MRLQAASKHLDAADDIAAAVSVGGECHCGSAEQAGGNCEFGELGFHVILYLNLKSLY